MVQGEASSGHLIALFLRLRRLLFGRRLLGSSLSSVLRCVHRVRLLPPASVLSRRSADELSVGIDEFLLRISKYFKTVFATACSTYVGAYFEKGLPERLFQASLQNSFVVVLL